MPQRLFVEGLGTFFLMLVIGLTALVPGGGAMAPLAIGVILMAMVYAGGPISGGHYNPAVTLAVWLRGKCKKKDVPQYVVAQVMGATLAALVVTVCKRVPWAPPLPRPVFSSLLIETLFTFALAYVVLQVATTKRVAGNAYFGLAIGSTLMAAAYAGGPISGGAFNPAVAIGLTLLKLTPLSQFWVFLVGNLAGGALAALVFRSTNPDD